jgi:16S rRNA U516 pseudouridylate synthase RsuA-like enzyme
VEVDGKQFVVATDQHEHAQVLMYHKPEGELPRATTRKAARPCSRTCRT